MRTSGNNVVTRSLCVVHSRPESAPFWSRRPLYGRIFCQYKDWKGVRTRPACEMKRERESHSERVVDLFLSFSVCLCVCVFIAPVTSQFLNDDWPFGAVLIARKNWVDPSSYFFLLFLLLSGFFRRKRNEDVSISPSFLWLTERANIKKKEQKKTHDFLLLL